ncbi:hypothetical protein FRB95_002648 [Tulasnella sp. JGI-2019a]|nr:hypothetical protein FRB95_002648 [Tulasnella sp. JGI-2019a]
MAQDTAIILQTNLRIAADPKVLALVMYADVDLAKPGATCSNTQIYRLPDDILLDILLLDLSCAIASERYKRLGQLMLVCSQWQALSIVPLLWAHVWTDQPLSTIKNSLHKSKDALLDVVYTPIPREPQSQWPVRMETNDLLLTTVHRWRSFEYEGYSQPTSMDEAFMDLHHLTALNLNSISLHSSDDLFFTTPFATRLHYFSVGGCFAPWDSGRFSGLETLILYNLEDKGPPVDQLVDFLGASPGLVTLFLCHLELHGTLSNHAGIITLQSLQTLEMRYTTCHAVGDLCAILHIPKCTRLVLKNNPIPESKLFSPSMEHLFPMLREIMASCDDTDIEFDGADMIIASRKDDEWILEISSSTTSTPQDWPIATREGLRNLLGFCPMEELTLSQRELDPYASSRLGRVLELLSEPRDVDGIMRWPLPNLKILEIVQGELTEQERLVNMIRNRYADREPRETYEPPTKLQSLKLTGSDWGSYLDVMEGILGQGW